MEELLPKISVIVPVYNVETYLDKCVDSIVVQTYRNLEIILIDDGSTDSSPAICDAWAKRDLRIKVIHQDNSGAAVARNNGLQVASGEYIGFVDSDDWITDTMYNDMIESILQTNADVAFTGYERVLENGERIAHKYTMSGTCDRKETIIASLKGGYFVTIWNKLFSRQICMNHGDFIKFEPFLCGEDEHWLMRVLANAKKAYLIDKNYYYWRVRGGSITYKKEDYSIRQDVYKVKSENCKLLATIDEKAYHIAVTDQYINMYSTLVDAYRNSDRQLCELMKKHISEYRKIYLISDELILSKCKKLFVESLIRLHLPIMAINFFDRVGTHNN